MRRRGDRGGGRRLRLRLTGTVTALDGGLPLRAEACGPLALGAGVQEVRALPGAFSLDLLQLRSPAPVPISAPAPGAAVLAPGSVRTSSLDGARVALRAPSWLVLGESFDTGWRASCNGRALGAPRPVDGYANGWLAPAGCRQVSFAFAPQDGVRSSYLVSGIVCLMLALFVLAGARPARRVAVIAARRAAGADPGRPGPGPVQRALPLWRAVALAAPVAVLAAAIFALRAGAVAFPLLTVLLWRGYRAERLTWLAAGLLAAAVPLIYVIAAPKDEGGYDFAYATQLIAAHWVGVAAIVLLALAAVLAARQTRRSERLPPSGGEDRHHDRPRPVEEEVVRR